MTGRSKITIYILVGTILLGAMAKGVLGTSGRGTVARVEDIPLVGNALASFKTRGPVCYAYFRGHRARSCIFSGTTTIESVKSFCRQHGLRFYPLAAMGADDYSETVVSLGAEDLPFAIKFSLYDAKAEGKGITLRFRYKDGRFFCDFSL